MTRQRKTMKTLRLCLLSLAVVVAGMTIGCSTTSNKSADVSASIRTSLDQANFKDVTVSQDRDKGVVTLGGHVTTGADKLQAETIARSFAGQQVVANQIAVLPLGAERQSKEVNSDLDNGIESNLDAALITASLRKNVSFSVKNNVVTLTGNVNSEEKRAQADQVAAAVPNVLQVVNELQVAG